MQRHAGGAERRLTSQPGRGFRFEPEFDARRFEQLDKVKEIGRAAAGYRRDRVEIGFRVNPDRDSDRLQDMFGCRFLGCRYARVGG